MTTTLSPTEKATLLANTLPHIQHFYGKTIVIKYGGNAMTEEHLQKSFAQDIVFLKLIGLNPIIVHGGGPQIDSALNRLGKKGHFIQGMRVTDKETMDVVEWVLGGQVQQNIVSMINQAGGQAVGLTGKDANLIQARKKLMSNKENPTEPLDIGHVGEVTAINPSLIHTLVENQFIPIISPIGFNPEEGTTYNINADVVAGKMAQILHAEKLLLMTNIPGVLDKDGNLLTHLSTASIDNLIKNGTISGGMIPKITSALEAAQSGIPSVHIVDGRIPHCLLLEMLTDNHVGTMITA
ncbi:acetylglutamate kinase [Pelistega ratti]|uniref:acetylglutamate kinase n=1 Tax=Pelistega ratti TaxID=2652177 RepID=UPI001356C4CE|nr:acetylglutamate kinase [Pelistega ratti]